MPSSHGERVVMRLLDKDAASCKLRNWVCQKPPSSNCMSFFFASIILVTGPTGSGKTTTLYAGLQKMDRQERNIMTVGIQLSTIYRESVKHKLICVQVWPLPRFARHITSGSDVILIGEIRVETAKCYQASLTGHLVLLLYILIQLLVP